MKDLLAQAVAALVVLLGALFAVVMAVGVPEFRRRAKQAAAESALRKLRELATTAVAAIEQTVVLPSKAPEKPGGWDDAAARDARQRAQTVLRVSGRASLSALLEAGSKESDLEMLVGALVEEAVLALRSKPAPESAAPKPPQP